MDVSRKAGILADIVARKNMSGDAALILPSIVARAAEKVEMPIDAFYREVERFSNLSSYLAGAAEKVAATPEGREMVADILA